MLYNLIDTLVGSSLGNEAPADTTASIDNSTVNVAGSVDVSADTTAAINATVGNEATSAVSALFGAGGMSVSGVLAGNMVNSSATANITSSSSVTSGIPCDHAEADTPESVTIGELVRLNSGAVYERTTSDLVAYLNLSNGEQHYSSNDDWLPTGVGEDYDSSSTTTTTVQIGEVVKVGGNNYEYQGAAPLQAVLDLTDATQSYASTNWQEVPTAATPGVHVLASDNASILANSRMVSASATSNDGGASILNGLASTLLDDYKFTSNSGSQDVNFGDRVWAVDLSIDAKGRVYQYMGEDVLSLNLGTQTYTDYELWKELDETNIIPNGLNVTGSDSVGIGGLVVRNDVRGGVLAEIDGSTVLVADGDITVQALENATIDATAEANVSSSGGSAYGTGTSLAVNGT
ncbi:MAG: hypothetical protein GY708_25825, partial [Actinomycetia bacterium]|nr:hypothetical protein [Actinomycetes bacterium]